MHSKSVSFAVVSTILVGGSAVVAHPPSTYGIQARDGKPSFPFDKDTISSCTFWYDNDGSMTCEDVISVFGVSMDNFVRWVRGPYASPTLGINGLTCSNRILL